MEEPDWMQGARALVGKEYGRIYAWDLVNVPQARHWCEIMGVDNPIYADSSLATELHGGAVVPPTMLQSWCLEGLHMNNYAPGSSAENPFEVLAIMEAHGYPSVVAVNSELEFDRYLHPGEKLYYVTKLDAISEQKNTALGTGWFVTVRTTYFSQKVEGDDRVGDQLFRVFKFRAPAQALSAAAANSSLPKATRPLPGMSDDTRFFWDGCKKHKLLIQRCRKCGLLRHPPGPICTKCYSFEWDTVEASGRGTLYSFVVMHYPEVPPFEYPNPVALVELEEGTRLIAGLVDVKSKELRIGMKLQAEFRTFDDNLVLPQFRPA